MQLSVHAKPTNLFQQLLDEGFSSTRSIYQDLHKAQCDYKDAGYLAVDREQVVIIDLSQLAYDVQLNTRFATLNQFTSLHVLLTHCHDYDIFNDLLEEISENTKLDTSILERIEKEGFDFVTLYRDEYLKPHLGPMNLMAQFYIQAVTPNMQCFVVCES